jgi:hypothetical protein
MTATEIQQQIHDTVNALPEHQLKAVWAFVNALVENELPEDFLMQMNSAAYHQWLSEENDIYDEVFKDEL